MHRINLSLELTDDMIDDAAIQVIKRKVREIVQDEVRCTYAKVIEEAVNKGLNSEAQSIVRSFNSWNADYDAKKQIRERLKDKAAELALSNEEVVKQIDRILQPVMESAQAAVGTIQKQTRAIDDEIKHQVSVRVNAVFGSALREALSNTIKQGEEE